MPVKKVEKVIVKLPRALALVRSQQLRKSLAVRRVCLTESAHFPNSTSAIKFSQPLCVEMISPALEELILSESPSDAWLIEKAVHLARVAHNGSLRASGEPYIIHPLAVARIVGEWGLGGVVKAMAIAHDIVEDSHFSLSDLAKELGKEVAGLVDGLTELGKGTLEKTGGQVAYRRILIKLLRCGSEDLRILIGKLADRLHNMRTLLFMPAVSQIKKARETLNVYARIAKILGIWELKRELQDLSFMYLQPKLYNLIVTKRNEITQATERMLETEIIPHLKETLNNRGIQTDVVVEKRAIYELYQRLTKRLYRKITDEDILSMSASDVWRLNIIAEDELLCFIVEGYIHSKLYHPVRDEQIDHYIGNPTVTGHQFLHSYVHVPGFGDGRLLIHVLTQEMYDNCCWGVLAKVKDDSTWFNKDRGWLQAAVSELEGEGAFLQDVYAIMRSVCDHIILYTPQGDKVLLPEGATVLDFARLINQKLFLRASRAKVNGLSVDLYTLLKAGDRVEIIPGDDPQACLAWLDHLVTREARGTLCTYLGGKTVKGLSGAPIERVLDWAREALDKECAKYFMSGHSFVRTLLFKALLKQKQIKDYSELLLAIGTGRINVAKIVSEAEALYWSQLENIRARARSIGEKLRLSEYYLQVESNSPKGLLGKITLPLEERLGYHICDHFPYVDPKSGKQYLVIAVKIWGGRRAGRLVGSMQRAQIRFVVKAAANTNTIEELGLDQLEQIGSIKAGSLLVASKKATRGSKRQKRPSVI